MSLEVRYTSFFHEKIQDGSNEISGIVGAIFIVLLVWFLLRRRRNKLEFDGNFDPDFVASKQHQGYGAGGGATLPRMDLADEEMMG